MHFVKEIKHVLRAFHSLVKTEADVWENSNTDQVGTPETQSRVFTCLRNAQTLHSVKKLSESVTNCIAKGYFISKYFISFCCCLPVVVVNFSNFFHLRAKEIGRAHV